MRDFLTRWRSFDRAAHVLMLNQFGINLGFYLLMPYLAGYLAGPLGLAAWAIGLVLGVRNFSQQGMFIVGGTLADRIGYTVTYTGGSTTNVQRDRGSRSRLLAANAAAQEFYAEALQSAEAAPARQYLIERNFDADAAATAVLAG